MINFYEIYRQEQLFHHNIHCEGEIWFDDSMQCVFRWHGLVYCIKLCFLLSHLLLESIWSYFPKIYLYISDLVRFYTFRIMCYFGILVGFSWKQLCVVWKSIDIKLREQYLKYRPRSKNYWHETFFVDFWRIFEGLVVMTVRLRLMTARFL
jgi:hypothetical protein